MNSQSEIRVEVKQCDHHHLFEAPLEGEVEKEKEWAVHVLLKCHTPRQFCHQICERWNTNTKCETTLELFSSIWLII